MRTGQVHGTPRMGVRERAKLAGALGAPVTKWSDAVVYICTKAG